MTPIGYSCNVRSQTLFFSWLMSFSYSLNSKVVEIGWERTLTLGYELQLCCLSDGGDLMVEFQIIIREVKFTS